jgi:hypothetical protein
MGVFQILWIYYGLIIASRPVILWTRSQCWSVPSVSARIVILSANNKDKQKSERVYSPLLPKSGTAERVICSDRPARV